jgi:hypothetical protein
MSRDGPHHLASKRRAAFNTEGIFHPELDTA